MTLFRLSSLKFVLLASVLIASISKSSRAETEAAMTTTASSPLVDDHWTSSISRGHWNIGGNFSYSSMPAASDTWLWIDPSAEYFFFDKVSLGGGVSAAWSSNGYNQSMLTPSLTYYFYKEGHFAYDFHQTVNLQISSSTGSIPNRFNSSVGFRYFFTPTIAFGPRLDVAYGANLPTMISALGNFSIFF